MTDLSSHVEGLAIGVVRGGLTMGEVLFEVRKRIYLEALTVNNFNCVRTAAMLKQHRNTFSRNCDDLQIDVRALKAAKKKPQPVQKPAPEPRRKVAHA